ncbi:hypothetical protein BJ322DRAFT_1110149 [Thelephora terrestris]|uniref:BTB domain-containing protein n=1 Tax=Thelephora terrestris TaxID=56493 RepID=A0A9P6HD99_9AGAM|nr:hypothetical protein BJ322DRAFT_1110149 [Thelephora terrestris]
MSNLRETLSDLANGLTEENYDASLVQYRFWFNVGIAHGHISDQFQVAKDVRLIVRPDLLKPEQGQLIHPAAHLVSCFIRDIEADGSMSWQVLGLQQSCVGLVDAFFEETLSRCRGAHHTYGQPVQFLTKINLIASWVNLGYVKRVVIDRILQSLIASPKLHNLQADALVILFRLAGPTFEAYVDPSVVDRSFELLKGYYPPGAREKLVLEIIELRENGWKGLPPPPVFATGQPSPIGVGQEDHSVPTVSASPGLSNTDPEPRIHQPHPLKPISAPQTEAIPASPISQSPSISIASLSDFTITDTLDDESPVDPTTITPHSTFYLEDGNVEVLCGNTLFRVHTSVISFHSPILRGMFAQTCLATAESPNGCPRVLSSDTATDFVTLLKVIYLPEFPERNMVPDFNTFSSLLRITEKYEMSALRYRLLEAVRDGYPDAFDKVIPTKPLGEVTFSGPIPHPNEVLNLFVQQKLTSALLMAYYMAARKGVDSFMDRCLPTSATLSPEILQTVIKGLIALRELERDEIHRLVLGSMGSHPCSSANCTSHKTKDPRVSDAHQRVIDQIAGYSRPRTKVLQVLSLSGIRGGFCGSCVKGWEDGHVGVSKKAWDMLPKVFGLGD